MPGCGDKKGHHFLIFFVECIENSYKKREGQFYTINFTSNANGDDELLHNNACTIMSVLMYAV